MNKQLSWIDQLEQDDEDLTSRHAKDFMPAPGYPHMPLYWVISQCWADGDTSPEALTSLAEGSLGEMLSFHDHQGRAYKYFCITFSIINNKVWLAYQFDRKLIGYVKHHSETHVEEED